jgi:hypothetical protein
MDQENIPKLKRLAAWKRTLCFGPHRANEAFRQKVLLAGVARMALLVAVILYDREFIAPYESTLDAFIDG